MISVVGNLPVVRLVSQDLFNPDIGLFSYSTTDQTLQINEVSGLSVEGHLSYFRFVGRFIAKSLYDNILLNKVHFVRSIYKHILGWPISMEDLQMIDYEVWKGLDSLLRIDDVSVAQLDFSITEKR